MALVAHYRRFEVSSAIPARRSTAGEALDRRRPVRAARALDLLKQQLSCRIATYDSAPVPRSTPHSSSRRTDDLQIDRDSTAIVRAILSLATAFRRVATAQGIESRRSARKLGALGCRVGEV